MKPSQIDKRLASVAEAWLCVCCAFAEVNGSSCDCPDQHAEEVEDASRDRVRWGWNWAPDFQDESAEDFDPERGDGLIPFSRFGCDGCGSWLAGFRFRFSVWDSWTRCGWQGGGFAGPVFACQLKTGHEGWHGVPGFSWRGLID